MVHSSGCSGFGSKIDSIVFDVSSMLVGVVSSDGARTAVNVGSGVGAERAVS